MKKTVLLVLTLLCAFCADLSAKEIDPFLTLIELRTEKDVGFIYGKTLLDRYKDKKEDIKEVKCELLYCNVSGDYYEELSLIADEVLTFSKDPLDLSLAWFRKAKYADYCNENEKTIVFTAISLKLLDLSDDEAKPGNVSYKCAYEYFNRWLRKDAFVSLGKIEEAEKEVKLMETDRYKWACRENGWFHNLN